MRCVAAQVSAASTESKRSSSRSVAHVGGGSRISSPVAAAIARRGAIHRLSVASCASCDGVWCGGTRVAKNRVSKRRMSIGGVTQWAKGTSASSASRRRSPATMSSKLRRLAFRSARWPVKRSRSASAAQCDEVAARGSRDQDAGLLEQLACRGHLERKRLLGIDARHVVLRARDPVAPVTVSRRDPHRPPVPRKHVRAGHERDRLVTPHQKYFEAAGPCRAAR